MKKPKLTREELSKLRSEIGKKGAARRIALGHNKGGRPKGSPNKNPVPKVPPRTLTVRDPDYQVVVKMANAMNLPIVEFMHRAAEKWKANNPRIFSPSTTPKV